MDKKLARVLLLVACVQAAMLVVSAGERPDYVTDEILEMLESDKKRCMSEHGTTQAMIDASNKAVTNERSLTCYIYCLFEAFSLVDEDGVIEVEMMVGFLPDDMQDAAMKLLEVCANIETSDLCDKMYEMGKCVMEKRPDLWYVV